MPHPRKPDPAKLCESCGGQMTRKRFNGRLEDRSVFLRRRFCDQSCMAKSMETDAPTLAALRGRTQRAVPLAATCSECGAKEKLQRHHKDEDKTNNTPSNVTTLCASCHATWHWRNGKRERRSVA